MDTRIFEVFSAAMMIVWAVGFFFFQLSPDTTSFGRADDYLDPTFGLCLLVPFALFHFFAILTNHSPIRRTCIMLSLAWWLFLSALMFQFPPNYSAGSIYGLISFFNIWCFIAARLRNEVGVHQKEHRLND